RRHELYDWHASNDRAFAEHNRVVDAGYDEFFLSVGAATDFGAKPVVGRGSLCDDFYPAKGRRERSLLERYRSVGANLRNRRLCGRAVWTNHACDGVSCGERNA